VHETSNFGVFVSWICYIGLLSPLPRQLRKLRLGYISAALEEVTCFQWILWTKKKNPCHSPYTHTHHIYTKKLKRKKGWNWLVIFIVARARQQRIIRWQRGGDFVVVSTTSWLKKSRRARRENHATRKKNYSYRLSKRRSHMEQVNPCWLRTKETGRRKKNRFWQRKLKRRVTFVLYEFTPRARTKEAMYLSHEIVANDPSSTPSPDDTSKLASWIYMVVWCDCLCS
jgi:hypothetical protein